MPSPLDSLVVAECWRYQAMNLHANDGGSGFDRVAEGLYRRFFAADELSEFTDSGEESHPVPLRGRGVPIEDRLSVVAEAIRLPSGSTGQWIGITSTWTRAPSAWSLLMREGQELTAASANGALDLGVATGFLAWMIARTQTLSFALAERTRWTRVESIVGNRRIFGPTFCLAIPKQLPVDPNEYLEGPLASSTNALLEDLLGAHDIQAQGIAVSVFESVLLTIRGEIKQEDGIRPRYLLLPLGERDLWTVEDQAWRIIRELGLIEQRAASETDKLSAAIRLRDDRVSEHEMVAEDAGQLAGKLARYLPVATGRLGDEVHGSIAVIQQTTLGSEAAVARLVTELQDFERETMLRSEQVLQRYDERLTDKALGGRRDVRDAIEDSYLHVTKDVKESLARAESIERAFRSLLESFGAIFESRRVREVHAVEGTFIRVSLLLLFVTILIAAGPVMGIESGTKLPPAASTSVQIGGGILLAVALGLAGYLFRVSRRRDRMRGRHRDRVKDLVIVLQALHATPLEERNDRDVQLAGELADALGKATAMDARLRKTADQAPSDLADDIDRLAMETECWSAVAMLSTERPFPFVNVPLPNVASVCFMSGNLPRIEFVRMLKEQCSEALRPDDVDPIDEWRELRSRADQRSRSEWMKDFRRFGLRLDMSEQEVAEFRRALATDVEERLASNQRTEGEGSDSFPG